MRRLLLLLCAAVLLAPAAASAKPILGIADNKPATFDDARFQQLGVKLGRLNIPWDTLQDPNTVGIVDAWMAKAKAFGIKPLVSFDRSRIASKKAVNPSNAQVAAALKAWRARWPGQIKEISAWNEPNINGKSPKRVLGWWKALRKACRSCTVLPGELVDRGNATKWVKQFRKAAGRTQPSIWALHAYVDANTFTTKNTKAFIKATGNKQLWLTETGGVVARTNPTIRFKGTGVAHQTKATTYLLSTIAKSSSRLKRIYIYSWSSIGDLNFDSGLVGPNGESRPAINVVRKYLGLPADPTIPAAKR